MWTFTFVNEVTSQSVISVNGEEFKYRGRHSKEDDA